MNFDPKQAKLNFPSISLRYTEDRGRTLVFDQVRKMWVVLTPEEWVRRHLVEYLIKQCGAPLRSIVEEYAVSVNSMPQRADVVVIGNDARPLLIAECKAPEINFDERRIVSEVFEQATRYNAVVGARYVVLTNGMRHFCFERIGESYQPLGAFPRFEY